MECAQGYVAHEKPRAPRTLQKDYAQGFMEVLEGGLFLMRKVPLHRRVPPCDQTASDGAKRLMSPSSLSLSSLDLRDTPIHEP